MFPYYIRLSINVFIISLLQTRLTLYLKECLLLSFSWKAPFSPTISFLSFTSHCRHYLPYEDYPSTTLPPPRQSGKVFFLCAVITPKVRTSQTFSHVGTHRMWLRGNGHKQLAWVSRDHSPHAATSEYTCNPVMTCQYGMSHWLVALLSAYCNHYIHPTVLS